MHTIHGFTRCGRFGPAVAALALAVSAQAQFTPTTGGQFDYSAAANWTGGIVNGQFFQTPAGAQSITFSTNTTLANGLTLNLGGTNPTLTLLGDGTANRTLTLGADISVNGAANSAVTIGSAVANKNLNVALGGNRTFSVGGGRTLTVVNSITGTGNRLTKAGTGTLILTGAAGYTGGTTVSAGTLQIGAGGTTGSLTGDITDNASVVFNRSDNLTFAGDVNGNGTLTKLGAGTLTLTGDVSRFVDTVVSAGVLQFTVGGSVSGNVINNASVTFNRSFAFTYDGNMSGTGSLTKLGNATLTLTGSNSYAGGTTVSDGVLEIGDTNALPINGAVTVASGAVLDVDHSQTVRSLAGAGSVQIAGNRRLTVSGSAASTFSGAISDDGGLTLGGTGSLTLSGANSYRGGTTITGGTLIATNSSGSATGTGTVTVSGGTLQIGAGGTTGAISGGIVDNAHVVFNRSNSLTFGGDISGNGTLTKLGAGTLTLTGDVSHAVDTVVSAGVLQFTVGGSVSGDVVNNASVVFNRFYDLTYGGDMSGTGSLTKQGNATLTLTGTNTYAGGTTVGDGTLRVGDFNALPLTGAVSVSSGALLDLDHSQTLGALNGAGAVTIANTRRLTLSGSANSSFSGVISDFGGLTLTGPGSLTLSGANTYRGGTTITGGTLIAANVFGSATGTGTVTVSGGTLQIGTGGTTGAISGDITDNASVVFNRSSNLTYDGDINGGGTLTKDGAGRLTLTGHSHYTGATTVSAGTLRVSATNALPVTTALALASGTVLDVAADQTIQRFLSSVGSSIQIGAGDTFTVAPASVATSSAYAGVISGAGDLEIAGPAGSGVTLTGASTFTGGTVIDATATLNLGGNSTTGSIAGNVVDKGLLVFNRSNSLTFGGVISGAGGKVSNNSGITTLTAANTYTGGTAINGGSLLAFNTTGSATGSGPVTVNSGGLFGGTGSIAGALQLNAGGTVAPGASPGTLTVGPATFASGAIFNFEINNATGTAGTNWDLLNVTGALTITSTAASPFLLNLTSLTPDNVAGLAANFSSSQAYSWQFLSTTGGVTGFTSPAVFSVNAGAFLNGTSGLFGVSQTGNNLFLNYTPIAVPEPAVWVLLLAGVPVLLRCSRRKA